MRIRLSVPEEHVGPEVINAALEAVTRLDEHMIRSGESPTSHELVAAGAVWKPEPPGDEHFDHGKTIAKRGWGDCDDWAPLHAATMRANGEDPGARAIVVPSGKNTWHAMVETGDGELLRGAEDISVMAGMGAPKHKVIGGAETIDVAACDPHDGRVYRGSLAPVTGPLSMHCGPQVAVRGVHIVGKGRLYQARCDMPMTGSPLMRVRGCLPKARQQVIGEVPTSFSVTSTMHHPLAALDQAIVGAILCGDAAELMPNLDRYQLIATQMGLAGHKPEAVREALKDLIAHDVDMAEGHTGIPGHAHVDVLRQQLSAKGVHVTGSDNRGRIHGFNFGDIGKIASGVVHSVSKVVNTLGKVPWGDIMHGIQAAVSVVPGLGTVVSEVIATAETAVNAVDAIASGHPILFAIDAAYNYATATIPGAGAIRIILDPYVGRIRDIVKGKLMAESGEIQHMLDKVPDSPKIGPISPRSVLSSLLHIVIGHLGMKNTSGKPVVITPVAMAAAARIAPHMAAPRRAEPYHFQPLPVAMPHPSVKPMGAPHAAVHVDEAQAFHARAATSPGTYQSKHWQCEPGEKGAWNCKWSVGCVPEEGSHVVGAGIPGKPTMRAVDGPRKHHSHTRHPMHRHHRRVRGVVGWNLFHAISSFASQALKTFQHIAKDIGPFGIIAAAMLGIPPDPTLFGGIALALMHAHAGNKSAAEHLASLANKGPKYAQLIQQVSAKLKAHPDFPAFHALATKGKKRAA